MNESPAEAVTREVREEAGLEAHAYKLAAVWDRTRHPHGVAQPFHLALVLSMRDHCWRPQAGTGDEWSGFLCRTRVAGRSIDPTCSASPTETHVRAHAPARPTDGLRLSNSYV